MNTMRAAVVERAGPPESFHIIDLPVPKPQATEVVVKQRFTGVNFGDVIRRKRGLFPTHGAPPYILGFEGVGFIEEIGSAVAGYTKGERVAFLTEMGGYAEAVAVPATQIWRAPDNISDEEAAGITCAGLTGWGLMVESGARPGDVALVHGAAGGVGSALVQILVANGIRTVALVTGENKQQFIRQLGAEVALDRLQGDTAAEVKRLFPTGVDVVFDCVGHDVQSINIASLRSGGTWMYYGSTSGHTQFPGEQILMSQLSVKGFVVFQFARNPVSWHQATSYLYSSLARGTLRAQTAQVLPLAQVAEAHRLLESRSIKGKVLLDFS